MTAMSLTRGQLQDLLNKFASDSPKYREKLISDPKWVLEKQLNKTLGNTIKVKSVVETADTLYIVVPHVAKEGELSDADLEKVAGGFMDFNAKCSVGGDAVLCSNVQINL